jgi:hypothetical protein
MVNVGHTSICPNYNADSNERGVTHPKNNAELNERGVTHAKICQKNRLTRMNVV